MRHVLVYLLFVVGCCPNAALVSTTPATTSAGDRSPADSNIIPSADLEGQLRAFAASWLGTPHVERGSTREGIDAPTFVQVAANEIMGVELPRVVARQLGVGEEILRDALLPGDLIFFRPTSRPRHVGIYLGNSEFAHAWHDGGVAIARLDDPYWNGAYWDARRVLSQAAANATRQSQEPERTRRQTRRRVGW